MKNETEQWKDIQGYENLYQISSLGRVKSLAKTITGGLGLKQNMPEIILSPNQYNGYPYVVLFKNGKGQTFKIHRLVANAFIPNPEKKPCVDHINTHTSDNRVNNLRWVTYKENSNNPITRQKMEKIGAYTITEEMKEKAIKGCKKVWKERRQELIAKINAKRAVAVKCIETNTIYPSVREAARAYNLNPSNISSACRGKIKTSGGYHWEYKDKNK